MKFCYQAATPDVKIAPSVTAFQGSLAHSFGTLGEIGYDGAELMTLNPGKLNWDEVQKTAKQNGLDVVLVCTGEIYGQLGLSFTDPVPERRREAIDRVKEIIDFAGFLGAKINIGRVHGQYYDEIPKEKTREQAIEAFREISEYSEKYQVMIALESVTLMQTNFVNTVQEAAELVDAVNHPNFKLMMDVFHLNIEEKDMYQTIKDYAKYNIHVHLADNNRRYPGHCGMNFEKVISAFHAVGYDDAFCTEIFQIPDQESAARGAMKHLAPIFEKVYGRKIK